jgi:arginine repressor
MTDSVENTEKAPKVNKTSMIRDLIAKNPSAKPAEIVKELAEKGIEVTSTFVSVTKSRMKNPLPKKSKVMAAGKRRRKVSPKKGFSAKKSRGHNSYSNQPVIEHMLLVKGLMEKMSVEDIISAANALKKLSY